MQPNAPVRSSALCQRPAYVLFSRKSALAFINSPQAPLNIGSDLHVLRQDRERDILIAGAGIQVVHAHFNRTYDVAVSVVRNLPLYALELGPTKLFQSPFPQNGRLATEHGTDHRDSQRQPAAFSNQILCYRW